MLGLSPAFLQFIGRLVVILLLAQAAIFVAGVVSYALGFRTGPVNPAETPEALMTRGLTCGLREDELAGFPSALAKADPTSGYLGRRSALPTYTRYLLNRDTQAFGYASRDVVLMPGRIVMLIPSDNRASVEAAFGLWSVDDVSSSKVPGPPGSAIAYEVQAGLMQGKLLLGCQYGAAASVISGE